MMTDLLKSQCLINGEWVDADSGETFEVRNPANQELVARVPLMGAAESARAVVAAERAFPAWAALPAKDRAKILMRWHQLILEHAEQLAALLTTEQGKPISESRAEVQYGASFIEWFAEEGKRAYGDVIPEPRKGIKLVVLKQPIGVVACITPWNFPIAMITRKCGPALAAGCTVIVKPAEATPLSALALATLGERAGLPRGVLNVITGSPTAIGQVLTGNPAVRKLSFTGSTAVGKLLMAQCAATVKKISLELGGNAPFIVFEDADLDAAVEGAIQSKFRNAGQTCVCANRIYVQATILNKFAAKLAQRVDALNVGHGMVEGVTIGPLINGSATEKVRRHIEDAVSKGAQLVTGGKVHALGGNFFEPTVLSKVTHTMLITQEETFGPVAPLISFETEEQAVQMANDSESGLAGYFFTRDLGRAWRLAGSLQCGLIGINEGIITNEVAPFGGLKESGIGREGSKYGLEEYLEIKYVCFGGLV